MMDEKVLCLYQDLIDIADGVRAKDGDTEQYSFSELKNKIIASYTGKVTLPDLSNPATYADLREGKQLIDENGAIVTGAMPEVETATPTISVGTNGLVTVSAIQPEGYVEAGTKTVTRQLTTQDEKTYTPSTANQYIAAQQYLTGVQTIKGDRNLKAENIKSGVSIFGVAGSLENEGVDLPELSNPGVADDLVVGKELIDGAGNIVVGTNPYEKIATDAEVNEQADLIAQAIAALEGKTAGGETEIKLQEKTVSPSTILQSVIPDENYDGLSKVTVNAMPTATQATPSISVSSSGLITASATQSAGYVTAGTKSATKQLTTQGAQTITPGTSNKTIASGRYLTGTQTIKGDSNLVAANIAKGKTIFGVTGTHEGGEDISSETAEYTEQLDELEEVIDSLPEAGGSDGGGGAVETCSIRIVYTPSNSWQMIGPLYYSEFVDGEVRMGSDPTGTLPNNGMGNQDITINNVVCRTPVFLGWEWMDESATPSGSIEIESDAWGTLVFFANSSEGGTVVISA